MQILTSPECVHKVCASWHRACETIALVPTMGFLHAGHERLIQRGREIADKLIVSIFVNPAQFGAGEDFEKYPRNLERDAEIAQKNGCDLLFAPAPGEMYFSDHQTWVEVPALAQGLCGASRPGHFRGVCTVVLKLIQICTPDFICFGEKDWQQLAIIKRMCRDLNITAKIISVPIVREADGLAMSSRNVYLSKAERELAPHIHKGLVAAAEAAAKGESSLEKIIQGILSYWHQVLPGAQVDYLTAVDPVSLAPVSNLTRDVLLACAIKLGKTRLIDNILLRAQ